MAKQTALPDQPTTTTSTRDDNDRVLRGNNRQCKVVLLILITNVLYFSMDVRMIEMTIMGSRQQRYSYRDDGSSNTYQTLFPSSSSSFSSVNKSAPPIDPSIPGILDCYSNPNYYHSSSSNDDNNKKQLLTFDVLVIGSQTRLDYTMAQRSTFGSHQSVRYFWNVSEYSDADPDCWINTDMDAMLFRSQWCRSGKDKNIHSSIMLHYKTHYAGEGYLKNKSPGWVCAQSRGPFSLSRLLSRYVNQNIDLPDYLLMTDDDTWVNMNLINEYYQTTFEPEVPVVWAGCLVRSPVHMINWTFPYGGYGTFFSKGSIERMVHPVHCSKNETMLIQNDVSKNSLMQFEADVCERLKDNLILEAPLFTDGMSVAELMGAHATKEPYCLHSDWATGYFVNFYNVSQHDDSNAFYENVKQARVHMYKDSEIYGSKKVLGNCPFDSKIKQCNKYADICHYQGPDEMNALHQELQADQY